MTPASLLMANMTNVSAPVQVPKIARRLNAPYLSASRPGIGRAGAEETFMIDTYLFLR